MNTSKMSADNPSNQPLLGRLLVQTRAVALWIAAEPSLEDARGKFVADCVRIHASRRWDLTALGADDQELNDVALRTGARVLTAHEYMEPGNEEPVRIWVLTEAVGEDGVRASTCVMFPDDY